MILAINRRLKKVQNKKGFTLVELLVVIAILGVLAAIIIPKVSGNLDSAEANTDSTNLKLLQNAVDRFQATTGTFPATLNALTTSNPPYIDAVPTPNSGAWGYDPATGRVTRS